MRLGQEVLSKIENLLIRCEDEPKKRRRNPIQQQENTDSNTFVKLYHDFKVQQKKKQQRQEQKSLELMKTMSPFKITNKHTIFLNAQKDQLPIHERLQQIQNRKFQEMLKLRDKYPPKKSEDNNNMDEDEETIKTRRKNEKKYSQQQAQDKVDELLQKQRIRTEKLHLLKVKQIQNHSKEFRCKPYVGKESDLHWNRYKMKKQLSSSVFERFEQYEMERKFHLEKTEQKIREELTPFAPRISNNSRLLASKSSSRTNLMNGLSRSCSCKCFQKTKAKVMNTSTVHSSRRQ